MQATSLGFGIVNAPGQRYHPAIITQAVATLCKMNPGRFWIAAGSGQFLNEHIDGDKWQIVIDSSEGFISEKDEQFEPGTTLNVLSRSVTALKCPVN